MHTKLEVHYLHDKIVQTLRGTMTDHSLAVYEQGNRFRIAQLNNAYSTVDTPYFSREYGNMTIDRAYEFLNGYLAGLEMGMSIPN